MREMPHREATFHTLAPKTPGKNGTNCPKQHMILFSNLCNDLTRSQCRYFPERVQQDSCSPSALRLSSVRLEITLHKYINQQRDRRQEPLPHKI